MPQTPCSLITSGTRTLTHAIGSVTDVSVGAGSYGPYPVLIAAVTGQSGTLPWPDNRMELQLIANSETFSSFVGGGSSGGVIGFFHIMVNDPGFSGFTPATLDNGFTIRFRSPSSVFNGVLAYAFIACPIDNPDGLLYPNFGAGDTDGVSTFPNASGTLTPSVGQFLFGGHTPADAGGVKGGYAMWVAGGAPVVGTTAADWSGSPGWSNVARIIDTNGSISIGFYNTPDVLSAPWSMSGAPISEANYSALSLMADALTLGLLSRHGARSFAQVIS